ncbi:hypothetical protein quinque_012921 [Culex quinquefasciatus]
MSDMVLADSKAEVGTKNERCVCAVNCNKTAGYEVVHGLLDRVMLIRTIGLFISRVVSRNALAEVISMDWHQKFGHNSGCKVVKLTGETGTDLKLIAKGQIIRFNFTYNASRIAAMSKPVYNAVTKFSPHKPVFARSRKLDRITDREHKPFLDRMANRTLKETLSQGVAYIHEGLTESDHHIVEQLFDFGAV